MLIELKENLMIQQRKPHFGMTCYIPISRA